VERRSGAGTQSARIVGTIRDSTSSAGWSPSGFQRSGAPILGRRSTSIVAFGSVLIGLDIERPPFVPPAQPNRRRRHISGRMAHAHLLLHGFKQ